MVQKETPDGFRFAAFFEKQHLTLARAARVAGVTLEEFVDLLGRAGVPAVDYPPEELDEEIDTAS